MKAPPCAKRSVVCRASQCTASSHISEPLALPHWCGLADEGMALLSAVSEAGLAAVIRHLAGRMPDISLE